MAYVARCRSNFFAIKDQTEFCNFCARFSLIPVNHIAKEGEPFADQPALWGFVCDGELISQIYHASEDRWEDVDVIKELGRLLQPGWVAVVIEVGYDKFTYLSSQAMAVNSDGLQQRLIINDVIMAYARGLGEHLTEVIEPMRLDAPLH